MRDDVTIRYKTNVLIPLYGKAGVLAYALKATRCFLQRCIATEELFLLIPQRWTSFYKVDLLNARCQWLEIAKSL